MQAINVNGFLARLLSRGLNTIERPASEHMAELQEIAEKGIPDLVELIGAAKSGRIVYDVPVGHCVGYRLWNDETGAGQRALLDKGTIFPEHIHESEAEVLFCISGGFEATTPEGVTVVGPFESIQFPMGTPHKVEAIADTVLIGITVPAAAGYPK